MGVFVSKAEYEHREYSRGDENNVPFAPDGKHPHIASSAIGTVVRVTASI